MPEEREKVMEQEKCLEDFKVNLDYHFSEIVNKPLAKPYWIYISLTHRCNFNCQMCGVKKILREHDLDFEVLKRTFREIASWKNDCVIMLTGGEIFLRKDIFEIIAYGASLGLKVEAVSNGSQINNPAIAAKVICSGLQNIAVSVDGISGATHDYIRKVDGAHRHAITALRLLGEQKRLLKKGPQLSAWTTIMKENLEELYDIIFLVKDLGVECLVYHPVIVVQDDMQNTIKAGNFWINNEADLRLLKRQIDRIVKYQQQNGLVAFLHDPYLWIKYFRGNIRKKEWKCNPFVFIDIGPDGEVRSCGPSFGNINRMSLEECLNTHEAAQARERMKMCAKPCLQTCWAKLDSNYLNEIVDTFISQAARNKDTKQQAQVIARGMQILDQIQEQIAQVAQR